MRGRVERAYFEASFCISHFLNIKQKEKKGFKIDERNTCLLLAVHKHKENVTRKKNKSFEKKCSKRCDPTCYASFTYSLHGSSNTRKHSRSVFDFPGSWNDVIRLSALPTEVSCTSNSQKRWPSQKYFLGY